LLYYSSVEHVVPWASTTRAGPPRPGAEDQEGSLPMDQPAITGRFSSRTPVVSVPKPTEGGTVPHQFPPSLRPTDALLKKIGLTCVLSAFLIYQELLSPVLSTPCSATARRRRGGAGTGAPAEAEGRRRDEGGSRRREQRRVGGAKQGRQAS
jgi:hypothetical protein